MACVSATLPFSPRPSPRIQVTLGIGTSSSTPVKVDCKILPEITRRILKIRDIHNLGGTLRNSFHCEQCTLIQQLTLEGSPNDMTSTNLKRIVPLACRVAMTTRFKKHLAHVYGNRLINAKQFSQTMAAIREYEEAVASTRLKAVGLY